MKDDFEHLRIVKRKSKKKSRNIRRVSKRRITQKRSKKKSLKGGVRKPVSWNDAWWAKMLTRLFYNPEDGNDINKLPELPLVDQGRIFILTNAYLNNIIDDKNLNTNKIVNKLSENSKPVRPVRRKHKIRTINTKNNG